MLFKKINNKVKTKLRKIAEFYNGDNCNGIFLSVFKNPTSTEMQEAKKESEYGSIRGIITESGDIYCWNGDILHDDLPKSLSVNVNGDVFRFAFENSEWIFDLHDYYNFLEGCKLLIQYEKILSHFDSLNNIICFYYASGNGEDYEDMHCVFEACSYELSFTNIDNVKKFINEIENKK